MTDSGSGLDGLETENGPDTRSLTDKGGDPGQQDEATQDQGEQEDEHLVSKAGHKRGHDLDWKTAIFPSVVQEHEELLLLLDDR